MRGNAGFSIVVEMIAAALLLLSVLALVGTTAAGFREFHNYRTQVAIIDQESLIVSALQSASSLSLLRNQLYTRAIPAGTALNLVSGQPVAYQGTSWFTYDHNPCTAGSSPDCDMKVTLDIECTSGDCWAGYRISSASASFAIGSDNETMSDTDRTVPIPFEITTRAYQSTCDPATTMFASGFDKVTGQMYCVDRPPITCGTNQVATQIIYDAGTRTVKPVCQNLRAINCPAGYSLQSFQPRSLLPDSGGVSGTCVYTAQNPAYFPQPPDAPSISGNFCPPAYTLVGFSCSTSVPYASNGNNCPWAPNFPYNSGSTSGGATGQTTGKCSTTYPPQGCGAVWHGLSHVASGYCVLTGAAEYVGAY